MPAILILDKVTGFGGEALSPLAVHVHFQPYQEINGVLDKENPNDTLYFRHLAIYILNKYFIKIGLSDNQHIPMPLGEVYKFGASIGMLSEEVYGLETSSFYNEHLDWDRVEGAFKKFGFTGLDSDYHEGFEGPDHNHFNQNHLYPDEEKVTFAGHPTLKWITKRVSTSHWMRIDFEPGSFPFNKKIFIKAINENLESLRACLTEDEYYFLSEYKKMLSSKKRDDTKKIIEDCILRIRQVGMREVYERQVELVRRSVAKAHIKVSELDDSYVSLFETELKKMQSLHSLAELRLLLNPTLYKLPHELEHCVRSAMEVLQNRYGDQLPSNVKKFFMPAPEMKQAAAPDVLAVTKVATPKNGVV